MHPQYLSDHGKVENCQQFASRCMVGAHSGDCYLKWASVILKSRIHLKVITLSFQFDEA